MGRYQERYTNDDLQILGYSQPGELFIEVWKMIGTTPTYELALCMQFRGRKFLIHYMPITEDQAVYSDGLDNAVNDLLENWWPDDE